MLLTSCTVVFLTRAFLSFPAEYLSKTARQKNRHVGESCSCRNIEQSIDHCTDQETSETMETDEHFTQPDTDLHNSSLIPQGSEDGSPGTNNDNASEFFTKHFVCILSQVIKF